MAWNTPVRERKLVISCPTCGNKVQDVRSNRLMRCPLCGHILNSSQIGAKNPDDVD